MNFDAVFKAVMNALTHIQFYDVIDILIIYFLIYKLIVWTKGSQAFEVLKGIGILFLCSLFSQLFQLNTLSYVLDSFLKSGSIFIIIMVLFQPEIRRVLERLGRSGKRIGGFINGPQLGSELLVRDVQQSIQSLSRRRVGMLLVFEQKTALGDIVQTGTVLDAQLSGALLENIFEPNTPLHDGAVIVREGRIVAAGCFLPLSNDMSVDRELGTRHRAALGISTVSDSITIIVSEETGAITMAKDGMLRRHLDEKALRGVLESVLLPKKNTAGITARNNRRAKA